MDLARRQRLVGRRRAPWIRRRGSDWVKALGVLAFAIAFAVSVLAAVTMSPYLVVLALALVFGAPFWALTLAATAALAGLDRGLRVTAIEEHAVVIGEVRVGRDEVREAWHVTRSNGEAWLEVVLRSGRRMVGRLSPYTGAEALRALGAADPRLARKVELNHGSGWPYAHLLFLPVLIPTFALPPAIVLGSVLRDAEALTIGLPVLFAFSVVGAILRASRPRQVIVGSDGIWLSRFRRQVLIPFPELAEVEGASSRAVTVRTKSGARHVIQATEPRLDVSDIGAGIAAAIEGERPAGPEHPILARAGRTVSEWRAVAAGASRGDYRDAAVPVEDAAAIVRDAARAADERVGAALALRFAEARDPIRLAAAEEPQPRLRAVFDALAEGDAADELIDRATRGR